MPEAIWIEHDSARFVEILCSSRVRPGPVIVGIDGRGGAGKSTLAEQLAAESPHTAIVHTDDIAWNYSFFGWDAMLADNILAPVRAGRAATTFRPPAWNEHDRSGVITVPQATKLLLVEGTGATRRSLASWYDSTIWVATDAEAATQRLFDRDGDSPGFVEAWLTEEHALLDSDQPWTRATFHVCGQRLRLPHLLACRM